MIGNKTNGDWADVTSFSRNEIVFEGRNKEYGAYAVRRQYNSSLLLALLIASSIGVLCAGIPFVIHLLSPVVPVKPTSTGDYKRVLKDYKFEKKPDIPKTITPPKAPRVIPPNTLRVVPPRIVKNDSVEKIPTNKKTNDASIGITDNKNPDPKNDLNPNKDPGPKVDPDKDKLFIFVQQMPVFPGGRVVDYLQKNTQYPAEYVEASISGTVYYTFIVEADGSVSNIKILKGVSGGPQLSTEVINALKAMPTWTPGMQNGRPVRVQYSGNISFKLRD